MTISEQNRQMILGALDSLGVALTEHDHEWTDGERTIYEAAVECVQRVNKSGRYPRRTALSCPCGFQGSTHNIREHRGNCEIWRSQLNLPHSNPNQN